MVWVDAEARTVAGLLRDADLLDDVLRAAGHRVRRRPGRWLGPGDLLTIGVRVLPGLRVPVVVEVRAVGPAELSAEVRSRPWRGSRWSARLVPVGTGTEVRDGWRAGPLTRLLARRPLRRLRSARAERLVAAATAVGAGAVVVATALVRDGAVLAAQRTRPPALAGRWELAGGRVEAGEAEEDAVVRECREELGCAVSPTGRVGTDLLIDAGVLRVHAAVLVDGSAPTALEHAGLRWVGPAELEAVDWVDADRAVLPDLRALLGPSTT
ncbi:NUDIX domain-containing protein [Pseudonocardia humida]|uniref:NUDIX domain-containing protein n=1 Tax=Pseudonocardia humida TaxID=2800819 RepID=UPI0027E2BCE8|nr:NUDIX domain-containing protein [Pseudonocardia humida]